MTQSCRSPGGIVEPRTTPPIRVKKRFKAKYIGKNVYDIGENISGWVKIKVQGDRGEKVRIRYSEALNSDGTIAPELLNTIMGSATHFDEYILSGNGIEEWSPKFAYHGFRYAEITGEFKSMEVVGEMIHTDFEVIGDFFCNDEMLNKIHSAARQSTLSNFVGLPTDCPQREQNAWTGDALISAEQTLMNFDAVSSYIKWLKDIADSQRPSGQICCIAPAGGWGYNWGSGPAYDSAFILIPYYIYFYTGNTDAVSMFWENMKQYMRFMESMSENDLVCFGLGDWCAPEDVEACPVELTDSSFFYVDNRVMAKCAVLMGEKPDYYNERAEEIKSSIRNKYIENDMYLDDNMTAIACAIYHDIYTEREKHIAAKYLADLAEKKGFHIESGILGMKFIFSALSEYGYAETIYKMCVNPEYPSYAYWINNGMTTLCERWDMKESRNHHMFSEIEMWLYKYVAGIRIDEGGKSVTIKPCRIPGIDRVYAKHDGIEVTINGDEMNVFANIGGKLILGEKTIVFKPGKHITELR